jgi:hypothetical protein
MIRLLPQPSSALIWRRCRSILVEEKFIIVPRRCKSLSAGREDVESTTRSQESLEIQRLRHLRNVGILAHGMTL